MNHPTFDYLVDNDNNPVSPLIIMNQKVGHLMRAYKYNYEPYESIYDRYMSLVVQDSVLLQFISYIGLEPSIIYVKN
ncbi:Hypothetical protein ORPV_854 [Orpheovirus IHUMI-LCC2]|uniref:Uncharacterized protein n=1 Tax=Orpheovirus IHUMI-LCC2 TaxID=2023057 RepID=A0A2I2L5D4_9VIRU|nr:Hypothetical protein ORPV_854 [Orpheovirus IHUMI-LCC2]SNW62758.1 Hypothetical protein ORPV_854 [Orpheovirus IHUMI-LCC2]